MSSYKDMPNNPAPITAPAASVAASPAPAAAAATAPAPIIIQQGGSRWGSFWGRMGWAGFLFCGILVYSMSVKLADYFDTSGGITEKYHSGSTSLSADKIAIISVNGAIMDGDGFAKKQIDKIRDDDSVKGVILRIDSPGGTVSGSDYIYHHLKKLRADKIASLNKDNSGEPVDFPMIVSMGSMAASGGYYIAMAVGDQPKSIFAEPTTTTGSIGVMIPHYDISGLLKEYDIKDDTIATHPRKLMLSMTKEMSPEERELVRSYINESFTRFKDIIKDGRPHFKKDEAALNELATGEIFTAGQAKKVGLVDEIGFIEDAIDRTLEIAQLEKSKIRVVHYHSPSSLFDLSLAQSRAKQSSPLEAIMELSTPKAYYVCTTLPGMVRGGE